MTTGYAARMLDENLDLNAFAWMICDSLSRSIDEDPVAYEREKLDQAEKELEDWRSWPDHVRRSVVETEVLNLLAHYTRERANCVEQQRRIDAMKALVDEIKPGPKAEGVVQYMKDQLTASTFPIKAIDETLAELSADTYVDEMLSRRERDLVERVEWRRSQLQLQVGINEGQRQILEQLVAAVGPPPIKTKEPG